MRLGHSKGDGWLGMFLTTSSAPAASGAQSCEETRDYKDYTGRAFV